MAPRIITRGRRGEAGLHGADEQLGGRGRRRAGLHERVARRRHAGEEQLLLAAEASVKQRLRDVSAYGPSRGGAEGVGSGGDGKSCHPGMNSASRGGSAPALAQVSAATVQANAVAASTRSPSARSSPGCHLARKPPENAS